MEFKLVIKPLAEEDIIEAADWFEEKNPSLSLDFILKISETLLLIRKSPNHFQKRYQNVRVVFTSKFPFGIYYTVEKNTVFVHAVLHTKRNPQSGIERL
ncbi:MAG: type II toxin-antitoxin system RelE/ParE family toxin [Flavobacteriaceae bacterium]